MVFNSSLQRNSESAPTLDRDIGGIIIANIKVLMTSFIFHPLTGGAEKQAQKLAKALIEKGVKVTYATAKFPDLKRREVIDGIPVYRLPCFPWIKYMRHYLATNVYIMSLLLFILRHRNKFDILHSHGVFDISSVAVVLAGKILKKPSIVKYASLKEDKMIEGFWGGKLFYKIIRKAEINVGNSVVAYERMINFHKLPRERCFFIPNGVVIPSISKGKDVIRRELDLPVRAKIAICVSNFRQGKNQAAIIKIWKDILSQCPESLLIFLGDGEELEKCQELAAELGVIEQIQFLGTVHNVQDYLQASDVFVFPSLSESMSNALLEAMAYGLPCVVSNILTNLALIKNNINGITFVPTNLDELEDGILKVFGDKVLAGKLGEEAKETIKKEYSIEYIAERYLNLYSKSNIRKDPEQKNWLKTSSV